ncbi:hypothetical protein [Oceanobacter mangrovi]|uniref:hypothetical protein n=1 Tax=Oceanobacter mangrovi TaxID=2862510 RepID=UPI001C8CF9FA|nr:hypothetical protein [Oceanobacter mangrovi]
MLDVSRMKKKPPENHDKRKLAIFLVVVVILVAMMAVYHYRTPSPFHNELFFGPMNDPEPVAEPAAPKP